jgi:adenylate cyclase
MPATVVFHLPERASRYVLLQDDARVVIGRDPAVDLVIEDRRVSKRHAYLAADRRSGAWTLEDLGSKNGTTVNGVRINTVQLEDTHWISFGGVVAQFGVLSADAASRLQHDRVRRLLTWFDLRRRLASAPDHVDLLLRYLRGAIELTGTERGFIVLVSPTGTLEVAAMIGFGEEQAASPRFAGSVGAVERVLRTGETLVISDLQSDRDLGQRKSVLDQGLAALACVPLGEAGRRDGVLYVDGRTRAHGLTTLDVEILEGLAEQAALAVAGHEMERRLHDLLRPSAARSDDDVSKRLLEALQSQLRSAAAGGQGPATAG